MVRRVLLYGNSVILGTLAASLQSHGRFDVTSLALPLPGALELAAMEPDVILFDLEASHMEPLFSLLGRRPNLLLVGVSPDNNIVKVWSSSQLGEVSTKDLVGVIDGQSRHAPADIHEGGTDYR